MATFSETDGQDQGVGRDAGLVANASARMIPDLYVEGVQIQAGYHSIRMIWTRAAGLDVGADPATEPVAVLRMSPQEALLLAHALRNTIRGYEEVFGRINLPDQVREIAHITEEL